MKNIIIFLIPFMTIVLNYACTNSNNSEIFQSDKAIVDFTENIIDKFNGNEIDTLIRYFAGNSRWKTSIKGDTKFSELINRKEIGPDTDWSNFGSTKVIVNFNKFSIEQVKYKNKLTIVKNTERKARINIERPYPGVNGYGSHIIVQGNFFYIEIIERSSRVERDLTKKVYEDICQELNLVYQNTMEIKKNGYINENAYYPKLPVKPYIIVEEGIQPGIYKVTASIDPTEPGLIYLKVIDVQEDKNLSSNEVYADSIRISPWSKNRNVFFHYFAEILISEGNWSKEYLARFELWHSLGGKEMKLIEKSYLIRGWER